MGQRLDPIQSNYSAGELDPQLIARSDADVYFTGAARARNVQLIPHGGYTRRPGLAFRAELPPVLAKIPLGGVAVTAPEGGTVASAIDGDDATKMTTVTAIGTVNPYAILHVDLGTARSIWFANVRNLSTNGPFINLSNELRIQHSDDDIAWTDFGTPFDNVTNEDSRWNYRRGQSSGTISKRYWRVVRVGATDGGTRVFELGEFELWEAAAPLQVSAVRHIEFDFSAIQTYALLATDRNIRVFRDGVYQADIAIPHTSAQLLATNWTQSRDNLFLFHEDVPVHRVERQGSDTEWIDFALAWTSIPTRDFNDLVNPGGGAEAVWSATRGYPRAGVFFKGRFYVGGTPFLPQTIWGSAAKGDFFDMLQPVSPVDDDAVEVTLDTDEVASVYDFQSADFLFVLTSSGPFFFLPREEPITPANVSVSRIRGKKRARGPGFRSFQLDDGVVYLDDSGESVNEIREEVFRGRFTVTNLAFLAPHLIRNPQDVVLRRALSSDRGDLVLLVNDDGSLAVLQTLRLRDFTGWTGWHTDGDFIAVGVDIGKYYAVVERLVDGTFRRYFEEFLDDRFLDSSVKATATSETTTATAGQAFYSYTFASPASSSDITVRLDEVLLDENLDYTVDLAGQSVTLTASKAAEVALGAKVRISIRIATMTGLDHLEGKTLRTRVDGAVGPSLAVTGGQIAFTDIVDIEAEAGLDLPDVKERVVQELVTREGFTDEEARFRVFGDAAGAAAGDGVWVRDMPADFPTGGDVPTLRGRRKRVFEAVATVFQTQGFFFAANGAEAQQVDFPEFGDTLLDRRPPLRTEQRIIEGLQGYTLDGQTEVTQRDPVPMTIVSVARKLVVSP